MTVDRVRRATGLQGYQCVDGRLRRLALLATAIALPVLVAVLESQLFTSRDSFSTAQVTAIASRRHVGCESVQNCRVSRQLLSGMQLQVRPDTFAGEELVPGLLDWAKLVAGDIAECDLCEEAFTRALSSDAGQSRERAYWVLQQGEIAARDEQFARLDFARLDSSDARIVLGSMFRGRTAPTRDQLKQIELCHGADVQDLALFVLRGRRLHDGDDRK